MIAHKRCTVSTKLKLLNFVTITVGTEPPRAAPTPHQGSTSRPRPELPQLLTRNVFGTASATYARLPSRKNQLLLVCAGLSVCTASAIACPYPVSAPRPHSRDAFRGTSCTRVPASDCMESDPNHNPHLNPNPNPDPKPHRSWAACCWHYGTAHALRTLRRWKRQHRSNGWWRLRPPPPNTRTSIRFK